MSKQDKIFNQCINEFKSLNNAIIGIHDLSEMKANKETILELVSPYFILIDKQPEKYKEAIKKEFAKILSIRISKEIKEIKKEDNTEKLFTEYVENFWNRNEMKSSLPFKNSGWGGAGLIITNDKSWIGNEDDIFIYTEDYRFVLFNKEVYKLCKEIIDYSNKFYFFEIIGKILIKYTKLTTKLEMTLEIFSELCEVINNFIKQQIRYQIEYEKKLNSYLYVYSD